MDVAYIAPSNKVTVMGYDPVTAVINGEMFNVQPDTVIKLLGGVYDTVTGQPSGSETDKA